MQWFTFNSLGAEYFFYFISSQCWIKIKKKIKIFYLFFVDFCRRIRMALGLYLLPLSMSKLPDDEWTELSADFLGPLPSGDYLLVIMDEYSRFPVVEILQSTSAEIVIPILNLSHSAAGSRTMTNPTSTRRWQSISKPQPVQRRYSHSPETSPETW